MLHRQGTVAWVVGEPGRGLPWEVGTRGDSDPICWMRERRQLKEARRNKWRATSRHGIDFAREGEGFSAGKRNWRRRSGEEKIRSSCNNLAYNGNEAVSSTENFIDELVVSRDNDFSLNLLLFSPPHHQKF
jgi:hypothetical protein